MYMLDVGGKATSQCVLHHQVCLKGSTFVANFLLLCAEGESLDFYRKVQVALV